MSIKRKPKPSEKDVEQFITKGGSAPKKDVTEEKEIFPVKIRPPKSLIDDLDAHLAATPLAPNRNYWILQAIQEKLKREKSK